MWNEPCSTFGAFKCPSHRHSHCERKAFAHKLRLGFLRGLKGIESSMLASFAFCSLLALIAGHVSCRGHDHEADLRAWIKEQGGLVRYTYHGLYNS